MWIRRLFRIKSIIAVLAEPEETPHALKRALGPVHLTLLGVGAIVGAGIFALVGTAAAGDAARPGAGPALMLSFVLTAVACGFTALCYAEFASMAPVSGSAYTYAYTSLGEIIAWIIGWDLILEYAVGNIAVAISWSGYFRDLCHGLGWDIPAWLATDLRTALNNPKILASAPRILGIPIMFNLPAFSIVMLIGAILIAGIRESAWFNVLMVGVTLLVLAFFVAVGVWYVKLENWQPFAPNGWRGIQAGAAMLFFAFIGFDAVSTCAEECRSPKRDLPIGILASLAICTIIYIALAAVLTGVVPWQELRNVNEPLSLAMHKINRPGAAGIVALGSVAACTAVLLVCQLGQARILYVMARDGLFPKALSKTHPRLKTPYIATIVTTVFVAVAAALADLEETADLCNIGTLSAFMIVCAGIIVLRWREPDHVRGFRTPWVPLIPFMGILSCLWLVMGLPAVSWIRFGIWLVFGIGYYAFYGYRHSRLNRM